MSLRRAAVRQAISDRIRSELPDFAGRVYINRSAAIGATQLPAIVVSITSEEFELRNAAPRVFRKTADLVVEVLGRDGSEDSLDATMERVLQAVFVDETFGGLVDECDPVRAEYQQFENANVALVALATTFELQYIEEWSAPVGEGSLQLVDVDYDLDGAGTSPVAEDMISLEGA